ncbi:MAG: hypothetical protein FWF82_02550 [Oscillospiraceae bacterium]|nr:hypothetical protein [Oscillospiraceae bacterium]
MIKSDITNEVLVFFIARGEEKYINVLWEQNQGLYYYWINKLWYPNREIWDERGYTKEDVKSEAYLIFRIHLKHYLRHIQNHGVAKRMFSSLTEKTIRTHLNETLLGFRNKKAVESLQESKKYKRNMDTRFFIRACDPLNRAVRFESFVNEEGSENDSGTLQDFLMLLIPDIKRVDKHVEQREIQRVVARVFKSLDDECKRFVVAAFIDNSSIGNKRYVKGAQELGLTKKQRENVMADIIKAFLSDN